MLLVSLGEFFMVFVMLVFYSVVVVGNVSFFLT